VTGTNLHSPDAVELKKALAVCREKYLLCMILQGSDNSKFYQLKKDMANSMMMGQDNFPKTIAKMQFLLNDCKMPPRQQCIKGQQ
jgi:hypothetical protein